MADLSVWRHADFENRKQPRPLAQTLTLASISSGLHRLVMTWLNLWHWLDPDPFRRDESAGRWLGWTWRLDLTVTPRSGACHQIKIENTSTSLTMQAVSAIKTMWSFHNFGPLHWNVPILYSHPLPVRVCFFRQPASCFCHPRETLSWRAEAEKRQGNRSKRPHS